MVEGQGEAGESGSRPCWICYFRPPHPVPSLLYPALCASLTPTSLLCLWLPVGFGQWEALTGDGGERREAGVFTPWLPACLGLRSQVLLGGPVHYGYAYSPASFFPAQPDLFTGMLGGLHYSRGETWGQDATVCF